MEVGIQRRTDGHRDLDFAHLEVDVDVDVAVAVAVTVAVAVAVAAASSVILNKIEELDARSRRGSNFINAKISQNT